MSINWRYFAIVEMRINSSEVIGCLLPSVVKVCGVLTVAIWLRDKAAADMGPAINLLPAMPIQWRTQTKQKCIDLIVTPI